MWNSRFHWYRSAKWMILRKDREDVGEIWCWKKAGLYLECLWNLGIILGYQWLKEYYFSEYVPIWIHSWFWGWMWFHSISTIDIRTRTFNLFCCYLDLESSGTLCKYFSYPWWGREETEEETNTYWWSF